MNKKVLVNLLHLCKKKLRDSNWKIYMIRKFFETFKLCFILLKKNRILRE